VVVLCCFLEIKLLDPVVRCFSYYMFMCVYKYSYNYYMFILHVHITIHVYHVIFRHFLHVNGCTKSQKPPEGLDSTLKLDASSTHGDPWETCEVEDGQVSHAGSNFIGW
jgi:hypothetical protein